MSRQIPMDKPLSDEDREYLDSRGRHDLIAFIDGEFAEYEAQRIHDNDLGHISPDAKPADAVAASAMEAPAPGVLDPTVGQATDVNAVPDNGSVVEAAEGDNYDDKDEWTYEELREEVKGRLEEDETLQGPALNSTRDVFVEWLRADDAREAASAQEASSEATEQSQG